ncbi:putative membrane protein [Thermococcus sp. 2319x1]|uniref:glycosyltransferase family 39 protein n=1 Tax=Thermococcus sp. 2319x1 TaxID=1674923 RepID=UPI00073A8ACE|nr:glycosyltransferase family 39 protein [Thermococcus sp. 2319x1]ALV63870.1 putative membrane protein [Thermococcus sp. 2319x1]
MKEKNKLILLWFILIFIPLFTLRLFQDEMLYLNMSRKALQFEFLPRSSLVFILTSPLMVLKNVDFRVFLPRIATSLITLLDLILIYNIAKMYYGKKAGFLSSLMFLFSFVALRYGARYTLEPWGTFFALLAVYYLDTKPMYSAVSMGLAFWAREQWVVVYPFYLILAKIKKDHRTFIRILLVSSVVVALNFLFIFYVSEFYGGIHRASVVSYPSKTLSSYISFIPSLLRDWMEFVIAFPLTTIGFIYTLIKDRKNPEFWVIIPSVLVLNGLPGFILNGPFERYTFGPLALMSIFSGYGITQLYNDLRSKIKLLDILTVEKWVALFLIAQFIFFNVAVLKLSDIGAKGIQDYGYWHDREVFKILEENANPNEFFVGTPHPALLGFKNWKWADRNIQKAIELNPDWLITFESWVNFRENPHEIDELEIYSIGPYLVIHAKEKGAIKKYVVSSDLKLWKFRK